MSLTSELITLIHNKPVTDTDLAAAALFTLDAMAAAYAGTNTPVGKVLINWAQHSAPDNKRQALLLGALTHITETDDLHRASVTHPGCVVVPVALACGEHMGIGPQKILRAILYGYEAMCRVGMGVGTEHYKVWHNTATCGPFGSAMAVAFLLNLSPEQTMHALGNAGTQSSGFWQFMATGAMSKHLHAGRAAESGWLAAEMAAFGFTGSPEIIEGEKGMFAGMCDNPVPDAILAEPDAPWQLGLTSIKPWPSCRHTHPGVDCALELHQRLQAEKLSPDAISQVKIDTYQAALDVCDRPQPDNEYQAKFSLYHCIAVALLEGKLVLDSFTEQARARTAALREVTQVNVLDPYASAYPTAWGSSVAITMNSGETFRAERRDCRGDPELMLSDGDMRIKAGYLMQYGGLGEAQALDVCAQILTLPSAQQTPSIFSDFISNSLVELKGL